MSHINVLDMNDFAQAKIQALEEKLNEATKRFQLTQMEFQAKLQGQDTKNKLLLEELKAFKSLDKVESLDPKGKGKESATQQDKRGQDDHINDCPTRNLVMDLDEQEQEHNLERH